MLALPLALALALALALPLALSDIMCWNTQIKFSVLVVIQQWVVSIFGSRF